MREPFAKRLIRGLEEALADIKQSGKDKYVNEKKLQTKVNPMGIRNDKEPADVPLEVDELSYSKKEKEKYTSKIEKINNEKKEKDKKSNSYFGNFDGHDGHSSTHSKSPVKVKKEQSDYERGNF